MKKTLSMLAMVPLFTVGLPAQRPWQQITVPSLGEAAANFKAPPHEYGAIQPFLSWNGPDANERKARIVQDLDRLAANGVFVVNMSPGRGEPMYLSPEHMEQVKFVVQEAAKRGMKLWLQDECDYPSGFAGGKIDQGIPATLHARHRRRHPHPRRARPKARGAGAVGHARHHGAGDRPGPDFA